MSQANIKVMISAEQIQQRVRELSAQINKDYDGQPIVAVCILKGGVLFFSDMIRELNMPMRCEFLGISSYGSATHSSGEVKLTLDINTSLEGKHVLIFEDIVDTGLTLDYLVRLFKTRHPASVKLCSLLFKPASLKADLKPDYCGFEIGNEFVIGYGLDYDGDYRQLPYVGVLQN